MGAEMKHRMFRTAAVFAVIAGAVAAAFSSVSSGQETLPEESFAREEVHFTVPGMEGNCRILWISDMHICSWPDDPDVREDSSRDAQERNELFRDSDGTPSSEKWRQLSQQVDSLDADLVVLGGDMLDYASAANLATLEEGLENIETDWMYIRADHDYGRWFTDMGIKKMRRLHRKVAPQEKISVRRFEDFTLVGLDNTTTAVTDKTLEQFENICDEGKPVLLCTHVPIDQRTGQEGTEDTAQTLAAASRSGWGDRVLCWGDGDEYDTAAFSTMKKLADLIYAEDSPVIGVLAGHLHLTWEGNLTDTCAEHVFAAAYEGSIGVITVSGAD